MRSIYSNFCPLLSVDYSAFQGNRLITLPHPLFARFRSGHSFQIRKLVEDAKYRDDIPGIGASTEVTRNSILQLEEMGETLNFLHIPSILTVNLNSLYLQSGHVTLETLEVDGKYHRMYSKQVLGLLKGSILYIHGRMKDPYLTNYDRFAVVYEAVFIFLFYCLKMHLVSDRGVTHPMGLGDLVEQFYEFAEIRPYPAPRLLNSRRMDQSILLDSTLTGVLRTMKMIHQQQDVYHLNVIYHLSTSKGLSRLPSDLIRHIASFLYGEGVIVPSFDLSQGSLTWDELKDN